MSKYGPIVIVDDDKDEQEVMSSVFTSMDIRNELIFFSEGKVALEYLLTTNDTPSIIFSDIKMPGMNGIEFRLNIMENDYLRKKSIPFVFFTNMASAAEVNIAYELTVQGFFIKAMNLADMQKQVRMIMEYWKSSLHPNSFSA